MDTRLKEIVDNFEKMKIGVDEPFKFHCTMCGKCCIHREDILLTPKDLYNMAKELKITPNDFVSQYCDVYVGEASRIPIVRIQPRGTIKRCPLLKDRKCAVHNAKPTVCAMFPIGRGLIFKPGDDLSSQITVDQIQYILLIRDAAMIQKLIQFGSGLVPLIFRLRMSSLFSGRKRLQN